MSRPRLERRNRDIFALVERRGLSRKVVAYRLGISYESVKKILMRFRRENSFVPKKF